MKDVKEKMTEKRLIERWDNSTGNWETIEMADIYSGMKIRFDGRDDMVYEALGEPYPVTNEHGVDTLGIVCEKL